MSGIYGIYRYDGAAADPAWLDRMRAAIAYYGPDGESRRIQGPLALGHLLLEVNPEDAFENQPVAGHRGLLVTNARLDNRDELQEAMGLTPSESARLADSYLVSLAFDRWGRDLCSHLKGDWSLAAWDSIERRLLLARDATGNANLYYHHGKGYIAFASSLRALLALPGVVREPEPLRLAQLLLAWQHNAELTAYKGFRRLVWANALTVAADGHTRSWRYWSCSPCQPLAYRRDQDYEEAFLEHYTRAVQSCLRSTKPIAAQLSAGRDSGSVVALAAPLLAAQGRTLTAYTAVPAMPPDGAANLWFGNEWDLAHQSALMAGPNVDHLPIDAAASSVLDCNRFFLDLHEGPLYGASNLHWMRAIHESAASLGARSLLTGQLGNAAVSWTGNGSAALALLQRQPAVAWRLFLCAEPNLWLALKRQLLKPILNSPYIALRRFLTPSIKSWRKYSALNPRLADELQIHARMRAAGHDPSFAHSPLDDDHPFFFSPAASIGPGISEEFAARYSLKCLDPTANLNLVEFLLRVPDDQFFRRRQSSSLFRRAFQGRLPQPVLDGARKGLQSADLGHRILRELPAFRLTLDSLDSLPEARRILDTPLLRRCLDDLASKVDPSTTARADQILLRGISVGTFLRRLSPSSP